METQSAFMAAAAAAVLLAAVLLQRRDRTSLRFAGLILAFGGWGLGRGLEQLGHAWAAPLVDVCVASVGSLALAAAAGLGGEPRRWRLAWPLLPGVPLLVLAGESGLVEDVPLRALATTWAIAGVGLSTLVLRRRPSALDADSPDATRLRYLTFAHVAVAAAIPLDLAVWLAGGPPLATLLVPLLYLYAGYLVLARVRVADLRQLLGNTLALALMAGGLAACFAAIRLFGGERLDVFVFNAFVVSFALLLFYPAVRIHVQRTVDRRFVAAKLALERALQPLRERLPHVLTLDELLNELLTTLERIDRLRASSMFLCDDPRLGFQQAGSIGLSPRTRVSLIRHPAWVEALERESILLADDVAHALTSARGDAERGAWEVVRETMAHLDAQLVLPLRAGASLVGFWTLSDVRADEPYSSAEVTLLRATADEVALSIANSKTFERIRVRDRLVNLGEMSAGLAHEIRNPLATIRGAVALLADAAGEPPPGIREALVEEVERLDRVVGTFLDYARPLTHRRRVEDVGGLVRGWVDTVRRHGEPGAFELATTVEPDLPPIWVDVDQLERVVLNLLQNACEATDGKGRVQVGVRAAGGGEAIEISVEDDGPGMDEATRERAFVPFFTTKESGTGLGLALCEKLVRVQGGRIDLDTAAGRGTTVRVHLPLRAPADGEGPA